MTFAVAAAGEPRRVVADGARRRLLELYTSEGCSSCPPAEAWLSEHAGALLAGGVVPLAFHVDYWDGLGWPDPFAQAVFTARQRALARRDGGQLYTPELALDGHELSRGRRDALLSTAPPPAGARLTLEVTGSARLHVLARAEARVPLRLFVALFENGLTVAVARGENAGRTLRHDFVVRALYTVEGNVFERDLVAAREWKQPGVAAFVEDARTGEVLQAVALPP